VKKKYTTQYKINILTNTIWLLNTESDTSEGKVFPELMNQQYNVEQYTYHHFIQKQSKQLSVCISDLFIAVLDGILVQVERIF
jgi:hypothetical protein